MRGAPPSRPSSDAAVSCDDDAVVDERPEPLGIELDVRVALRVREHDAEPAELQVEHEIGELQRPAEIRELEQEQRRVAAEAESAKLVVVEPRRELEVELTAR